MCHPRPTTGRFVSGVFSIALAMVTCAAADEPYFISLEDPNGQFDSYAQTISADGSTVIGLNFDYGYFRWTRADGAVPFTDLGGIPDASILAVNADGTIGAGHDILRRPIRWSLGSGAEYLSTREGAIFGASADGSVLVGDIEGHACRWTAQSGIEMLPEESPGCLSEATSVSADGTVIVGYAYCEETEESHALIWTAAGVESIGLLLSRADAVSADGSAMVGSRVGSGAFRWTRERGVKWLDPHNRFYYARGVSRDGSVIVGDSGGAGPAYIWTADQAWIFGEYLYFSTGLDPGWYIREIAGISADGRTVAGSGSPRGSPFVKPWLAYLGDGCGTPGDLNRDGAVDLGDLTRLLGHFGQVGFPFEGDVDWEGHIDITDLAILLSNFGVECTE